MSIQSEIERISQAKTDIHSAIESKGVTVPDDTLISEMAPYIQQIREAGTVVTSVSNIEPDEGGNVQLDNLTIYCGGQSIKYNGGAEQALTISPATIGAATAAQGALAQTAVQPAQIADFITAEDIPDELPNPYSLSIRFNGTTQVTYNGSSQAMVNITPNGIGAAPIMHSVTNTTYGVGTQNYYGHVRLSDSTSSSFGQTAGIAATPLAVYSVNSRVDNVEDSVPITRRITISTGWSTSYGDTGTDFAYGRIVSFTGSTTSHEVTGIYVTGQYTGSSPTDAQKTAASTWTYVECENNRLHFYSPTLINTTFYLVVTIQRL